MDEKSRSTSSVCAALMERSPAGDSTGRENKREEGMGAGGGVDGGSGMTRHIPQALQQRIQKLAANGLGQHVGDAVQKGLFFPLGLVVGGVGDDGFFGGMTTETFDDPNSFNSHQVHVEDACARQAMLQKRFSFIHIKAMNDPVLLRIQTRANGFGEVWMSR